MQVDRIPRRFRWGLPLLLAALVPAACDDALTDPGLEPPEDGRTTLSVYLTDAPGEVADVWVEVMDIQLVGGEGGPRSVLEGPTELISLLDLQDDVLLLVDEYELPPGHYHQVRFIIGGAVLETVDGRVYAQGGAVHPFGLPTTGTLHCPSCAQTGIKVQIPGGVELHEGANGLLLDFDVAQSFGRQAGQSGRWVMRPVIKGAMALPEEIENGDLGSWIVGTVALALDPDTEEPIQLPVCAGVQRTVEDFYPMATALALVDEETGEPIQAVGTTQADGSFSIPILWADDYALGYWEEVVLEEEVLTWEAEVTPSSVPVPGSTEVGGVVYTIMGATCEAEPAS